VTHLRQATLDNIVTVLNWVGELKRRVPCDFAAVLSNGVVQEGLMRLRSVTTAALIARASAGDTSSFVKALFPALLFNTESFER
jgi:hypothetical protein